MVIPPLPRGLLTTSPAEALELYAEVVDDARARPGAHPNIDILLDLLKPEQGDLDIVVERS